MMSYIELFMKKEKILYLTAYVPNKAAAGEKNTMIMLNDLASVYDIDLVYFKYDKESEYVPEKENIHVAMLLKNSMFVKIKNILNFPFVHPVFSIRFSWIVLRRLKKLIHKNDYKVIILNHSNMFFYGKFMDKQIPKIQFCHDVIAQRVIRSSSKIMQKFCIYSEKFVLDVNNSNIFSFSQKDCNLINEIYNKKCNLCLDYIDENIITKTPVEIGDYFTMFGDWTRKENLSGALWFFKYVTLVLKERINIKIIGRGFPDLKEKYLNINIDNLGFVEDPYQIISNSKALITPLFAGAGIKVKVIEALACGTPVIGSEIAFEGLPDRYKEFMILCKKDCDFAEAIKNVNFDIDYRKMMKKRFINDYKSESIMKFINRL